LVGQCGGEEQKKEETELLNNGRSLGIFKKVKKKVEGTGEEH